MTKHGSMAKPPDWDLIRRARDGDEDAWRQLLKRHRPGIDSLCRSEASRRTGGADPDELESATHLAFLNCVKHFDRAKNIKFFTYLHWAVRHELRRAANIGPIRINSQAWKKASTRAAAEKVTHTTPITDHPDIWNAIADPSLGPLDLAIENEQRERVEHLLSRLPDRWREVVDLRMRGEKLTDIGRRYGISRERVRQIQNAAIRRIQQMLGIARLQINA